jgi:hypothetical protein
MGRKDFFLERKKQRTFSPGAAHGWCKVGAAFGAVAKVFWFFFQKRTSSLPLALYLLS